MGEITTSNNYGVKIYPNPTSSLLTLDLTDFLNENMDLSIHNSLGQLEKVYPSQKVEQAQLQLNVADILSHSGHYILTISLNGVETKHPFVFMKN
ncbi:MAG: T9SS type A sorting domain-containing protein [Saprospiraceae bacterium]